MQKIFLAPRELTDPAQNKESLISASMGKGCIQGVNLKSGIQLITMDYTLQHPVVLEYLPPFVSLGFGFCLSGRSRLAVPGKEKGRDVHPGQAVFNSFPDIAGLTETIGTERVMRVNIFLNPAQFYFFAEREMDALPPQFENLSTGVFHHGGKISPAMHAAVFQILNCPYRGWARRFFLEGKVLELIAHKLAQIGSADRKRVNRGPLGPSDMDRIHEAARLLAGDLENKPDLNRLALSVGMCRSKLHRCFRMVYGVSPFEYLRRRRLETAMALLADGRMNVTQAAYAVGYSSPSYFTKAFKKYFGCLPGRKSRPKRFSA